MTKFIKSLDDLKGSKGKLFWVDKEVGRLYSYGQHEALFELLNKNSEWVTKPISQEEFQDYSIKKISKAVKYGDLRNLAKDRELKELFDTFVGTIHQTFEEGKAEYYLNNNIQFRQVLKDIRKGVLYFNKAKDFFRNTKIENIAGVNDSWKKEDLREKEETLSEEQAPSDVKSNSTTILADTLRDSTDLAEGKVE